MCKAVAPYGVRLVARFAFARRDGRSPRRLRRFPPVRRRPARQSLQDRLDRPGADRQPRAAHRPMADMAPPAYQPRYGAIVSQPARRAERQPRAASPCYEAPRPPPRPMWRRAARRLCRAERPRHAGRPRAACRSSPPTARAPPSSPSATTCRPTRWCAPTGSPRRRHPPRHAPRHPGLQAGGARVAEVEIVRPAHAGREKLGRAMVKPMSEKVAERDEPRHHGKHVAKHDAKSRRSRGDALEARRAAGSPERGRVQEQDRKRQDRKRQDPRARKAELEDKRAARKG